MLIFVAKILWSTTHAPQNAYMGAPQKRFSLLVGVVEKSSLYACSMGGAASSGRKRKSALDGDATGGVVVYW
jgi:hypothetical protein